VPTSSWRVPRYRVTLVRDGSAKWETYPRFANSREIFAALKDEMATYDREKFFIFTLDCKNKLIGCHEISVGSLTCSVVYPREVFKAAILDSAASIIMVHNHPSGDATPSKDDRDCTQRLCKSGQIIGIKVLDHIVIGTDDYFSFCDSGLMSLGTEVSHD
jgi:DNA repair protein RadC